MLYIVFRVIFVVEFYFIEFCKILSLLYVGPTGRPKVEV